jgi:hypothetical protein
MRYSAMIQNLQTMIQNIQTWFGQTRFIWADRVALLTGFLLSSLLLCFWLLAFLVVGTLGAKHLWENFGIRGVELDVLITGSTWFVMRAADLLASGRMGHRFGAGSNL